MKLINFGLFQLGWFIAIWGASHQTLLASMIAISFILTIHIIQARDKKEAVTLLLMIMLLGPLFDQCLLSLGLIEYKSQFSEYIVPIWIVALWGLFASTLNISLSWLRHYKLLAVLIASGILIKKLLLFVAISNILYPLYLWLIVRGSGAVGSMRYYAVA